MNLVLVVNWRNVRLFNDTVCPGVTSTFQAVLYEHTNIIEIYVKQRALCTNWLGGLGIIGITNDSRTYAVTPPNRNATTWQTSDPPGEAWRFRPTGPSQLKHAVMLYDQNNQLVDSVSNLTNNNGFLSGHFPNVCLPPGTNSMTYYLKAVFASCGNDPDLVLTDTVTIQRNMISPPASVPPISYCLNEPASPLQASTNLPNATLK